MDISYLSDIQLKAIWTKIGKDMTDSSSTRSGALEKDRAIYTKELFRRGLVGYKPKKKYMDK